MLRDELKEPSNLGVRLAEWARRLRTEAKSMPPGVERARLLQKARQSEVAIHLNEWLSSPGLKPPT